MYSEDRSTFFPLLPSPHLALQTEDLQVVFEDEFTEWQDFRLQRG